MTATSISVIAGITASTTYITVDFFFKLKNREEFEGELREKGREKERKEEKIKEKSNKHTLKCLYEAK